MCQIQSQYGISSVLATVDYSFPIEVFFAFLQDSAASCHSFLSFVFHSSTLLVTLYFSDRETLN